MPVVAALIVGMMSSSKAMEAALGSLAPPLPIFPKPEAPSGPKCANYFIHSVSCNPTCCQQSATILINTLSRTDKKIKNQTHVPEVSWCLQQRHCGPSVASLQQQRTTNNTQVYTQAKVKHITGHRSTHSWFIVSPSRSSSLISYCNYIK